MRRVALFIATAGGSGYFPIAPGTVGSAVGVALYFATRPLGHPFEAALLAAIVVVGVWASTEAARHFDREDPGYVVIDEVAGQLLTYLWLDVSLAGAVLGFFVFRVLDIIKPWPAASLEHLPGGWGIMADDLMAGVYGWILLWLATRYIPLFA